MGSKLKILLAIVLVVVLVVIVVGVLSCGDDGESGDDGPTAARDGARNGGGDDGGGDDGGGEDGGGEDGGGDGDESSGEAPPLRTVKSKRGEGENAVASVSGIIEKPKQIWLRISAAPKQQVKGQWNVSCGGGSTDMDTFEVTPPHLMRLRIPRKNADSCVAGTTAQLGDKGRLKVAILRDR